MGRCKGQYGCGKGKKKIILKIKSITNRCLWSQLKETPGNVGHSEVLGFWKNSGQEVAREGAQGPERGVGGYQRQT